MPENESFTPPPEQQPEREPALEEVKRQLEQIIGEQHYVEVRKREDGQGVYLWEVKVEKKEGQKGHTEYAYMRKGKYPEGFAGVTAIHVEYYDEDGMPEGGTSVAKYEDGEWRLTP